MEPAVCHAPAIDPFQRAGIGLELWLVSFRFLLQIARGHLVRLEVQQPDILTNTRF